MKINVLVTTSSKHNDVVRVNEGNYRVRVDAPAVEGNANKRLIEILAEYFNVPKSSIKILRGLKNRNKTVSIDNL